jgi:acyl-CoA synthetase (AMP-forming)/AMP-acid ligase II
VEIRIAGGEIQVRGLQLMTSWYPPDALSSPWTDDGWLRTGDRGALDERGWLVVRGRRDELIVSGGENVDPNEVSSVLSGHPAVREACVVGVPDVRWGQRVVAVIERVRGASLDAEGLRSYLRDRLATFKCPREIHVVAELPRTESGKVDRKAVARRAGSRHGGSMPG